jgi:hypothetical protein
LLGGGAIAAGMADAGGKNISGAQDILSKVKPQVENLQSAMNSSVQAAEAAARPQQKELLERASRFNPVSSKGMSPQKLDSLAKMVNKTGNPELQKALSLLNDAAGSKKEDLYRQIIEGVKSHANAGFEGASQAARQPFEGQLSSAKSLLADSEGALAKAEGSLSGKAHALASRLGIKDPKVLRRLAMGGGVGALGLGGLAAYNALS